MSRILRIASAVLLLGSGIAQAAWPEKADGRAFDARIEFSKAFKAPPALAQLQGVAGLKQAIPDLGVTFDDTTGVTRSLVNHVGFLTHEKRSGEPKALALEWAEANIGLLGLAPSDLAEYRVGKNYRSSTSGVTHLYLEQMQGGIPVYHGVLHFNIAGDGRILSVNNQVVPDIASAVNASSPALSAAEAVAAGVKFIGLAASPRELGERKGVQQEVAVEHAGLSQEPIVAKLMYLPVRGGDVRLVWVFAIYMLDSQHWYEMTVDAQDGKVWTRFDYVASDSYKVYHRPVEAPTFTTPLPPADGRTLEVNPADTTGGIAPSPFGWHDTNGVAGAELTTTQGNNAHAYIDRDGSPNVPDPGTSPDGGPGLAFDFPIDLTQGPLLYQPAAVTNLFHWNNLIHDIQYRYGFDEVAGNFQENNYGRGGVASDYVQAEAQDGSGTNGANFSTPSDGNNPRMQMFIWTLSAPQRDGDFDNGVIVHEYGHGISNRQVGNAVTCLQNNQQPGEGISDVLALMYTGEVGDAGTDGRGIGTYILGQATTGAGIRTQRYSTDPAINTWTYASIAGSAIPHGVGEKWAEVYWKVYWKLVDFHGFSANLPNATGGAGNQRAMLYFNEGLKNSICSPAFTDLRDSIVAATTTINAGVDTCRVWSAFAPFGLGIDAVSGGPNSTTPTNGFLLPVACRPAGPTNLVATAGGANQINLTWTAVAGAVSYRVYRANGACPQAPASFVQIATGLTSPAFSDNTVSGGNTYAYVVTHIDASTVESGFSNCDDAVASGSCTTPPTFAGLTSVTNAGTSSCALNLAWTAGTTGCVGSTLSYNVYRSLSPGFIPGPANLRSSCVAGTGFTDTTVTSGTPYYYVVRAEDSTSNGSGPCNSGNQETNTVERSGAAFGNTSSTVTDNVESGGGYWSNAGGVGTNLWTIVTDFSNSPTHAWKVTDPATVSDQRLTTVAAGNIPASFVMSWFQRYDTEASTTPGVGFDGHVLEYSLNGSTWTDILAAQAPIPANPARFLMNGYNRTISGSFASPLANRLAWSGQQLPFQQVQVNLADFSGQNAFFRFRFASDNSVADVGVWIDDITFRAPGACGGAAFIRGDFNTDGKTDILWRHDTSGENVLWYMNGAVLAGGEFTTPAALTDTRWKMVGTHDFNADLKNDILWRHDTAGENVLWYMNGSVLTSGEFLTPAALADVDWKMAGTGDFNGDGKPDIAWRHQVVGEIVLWYMNGSVLTSGTFTTPSSFTPAYALVGVADFSNPLDGKPDFVWRNNTTGENLIWFMNGATMIGSATTTTLADTGWKLVATGDYNLDLKNDFVWRHDTSGENVIWFMNGATLVSGTFTTPASFPDTRWKMVGPR